MLYIKLYNVYSGLGQVSDLHLARLDEATGLAVVDWVPADNETDMGGYIVYYRSLPVPGQDDCPVVLEEHEMFLNQVGELSAINFELSIHTKRRISVGEECGIEIGESGLSVRRAGDIF